MSKTQRYALSSQDVPAHPDWTFVNSPQDTSRGRESRLASEIADDLTGHFPALAVGPVLAVVVRAMADLRRIAVSADTAASADDYRRVIFDTAYHQLQRL